MNSDFWLDLPALSSQSHGNNFQTQNSSSYENPSQSQVAGHVPKRGRPRKTDEEKKANDRLRTKRYRERKKAQQYQARAANQENRDSSTDDETVTAQPGANDGSGNSDSEPTQCANLLLDWGGEEAVDEGGETTEDSSGADLPEKMTVKDH